MVYFSNFLIERNTFFNKINNICIYVLEQSNLKLRETVLFGNFTW